MDPELHKRENPERLYFVLRNVASHCVTLCITGSSLQCRDPKASDEEEYLENLFDVLCTCLMQLQTRSMFYQQEGEASQQHSCIPPAKCSPYGHAQNCHCHYCP